MTAGYKLAPRNLQNVQFADIRQAVDPLVNACHDALSAAYYGKKPFVWNGIDYGVLDKATFDKLHGLLFLHHEVLLAEENERRGRPYEADRLNPTVEVEDAKGGQVARRRSELAAERIAELEAQGLRLKVK